MASSSRQRRDHRRLRTDRAGRWKRPRLADHRVRPALRTSDVLTLNGRKKWISCGQFAAVFLVFGMLGRRSVACLVPRDTAGASRRAHRRFDGVSRGGSGRASLRQRRSAVSQHRRQTWLRAVACRAGRPALRKNQHRLLGAGTPERLLRRERRLRVVAADRRQNRRRHRHDPIVDRPNGHRSGGRASVVPRAPAARRTIISPRPSKRP